MTLVHHVLPSMFPQTVAVGLWLQSCWRGEFISAFSSLLNFLAIPWERGLHFILLIHPLHADFTELKGKGSVHSRHLLPSSEPTLLSFSSFLPSSLFAWASAPALNCPAENISTLRDQQSQDTKEMRKIPLKVEFYFSKVWKGKSCGVFFSSYFESYYNFFLYSVAHHTLFKFWSLNDLHWQEWFRKRREKRDKHHLEKNPERTHIWPWPWAIGWG